MADQNDTQQPVDAFSARMFDHDAGKYVDVPAHQVTDFVKSGRYTFPAGVSLPVVNDKGELGEVRAEDAFNGFTQHGIQWATPQLKQAAEQQQQQQIQTDRFSDMPLTAAIAGAARAGTLGGSDVALSSAGLGDAARATAQENPAATFGGELVGTGLLMAATDGLGGLGEAAGAGAGRMLASTGASKAVQTIGSGVVREATSGAVFGLGSGVSEQALGHPDDVVDNLVSHVGMGALIGGSLGGVFGTAEVARPYMSNLVEKATQGGYTLANKAVSAVTSGRVTAALNNAGEEEAAKILGPLAKDPQFMDLYREQGPNAVRKAVQENADIAAELKGHISSLENDLRSGLKSASNETKNTVAQAVQDAGGNIFDANTQVFSRLKQAQDAFDNITQTMTQPLHESSTVAKRFNDAVDVLQSSKSPIARNVANKIDTALSTNPFKTAGDEAGFMFDIQQKLKNLNVDSLDNQTKSLVKSLIDEAETSLLTNPNPAIAHGFDAIKGLETASEQMRLVADKTVNRITKATLQGETTAEAGYTGAARLYDESKIARTLVNPQTRSTVSQVLANIEQFAPEIKQASAGLNNVEQKIAFQNALEAKMSAISPKGHIDGADVQAVLDQIGSPKDLSDKLEKLVQAQKTLDNPSAVDRVIAAKQILGKPVSQDILSVAKYQKQFDFLNKVGDVQGANLNPLRIGRAAMKLIHGNVPGALMDAALAVQKASVSDYFNVLAAVQKASAKGAQTVEKAVKMTANALTNDTSKALTRSVGVALNAPSMKDQRKQYPKLQQMLQQPQQAHPLQDHAPQLAQAFSQRQQQAIQYLAKNLPQDPLKESSIFPNKTGYMPSDQELSSFSRRVQAVNNPLQVLDNISKNKASSEEIDALKTLSPQIYQKLQTGVINSIVNSKRDLSYQQKVQLGTLFDLPTDYSLRPDFIARMQQNLNPDQGGRPVESSPGKRSVKIDIKPAETTATEAQQITYGLKKD